MVNEARRSPAPAPGTARSASAAIDLSWLPPEIAAAVTRAREAIINSAPEGGDERKRESISRLVRSIDYHLVEYRTSMAAAPGDPLRAMTSPLEGNVLDVGCGFGQVLLTLSRGARGACLVGVDRDLGVLRFGARLIREMGDHSVALNLLAADALQLPFKDGHFDLVICRDVLMSLPARPALKELARVVAPGGRLFIHDVGAGFYLDDFVRGKWKGSLFALLNGTLLALVSRQVCLRGLWNNYQTVVFLRRTLGREGLVVRTVVTGSRRWGLPLNVKILAIRPGPGDTR